MAELTGINNKFALILLIMFSTSGFFKSQNVNKNNKISTNFVYVLQAKPNKKFPNKHYKEFFSLQVLEQKAYFTSIINLKRDSIFQNAVKKRGNANVLDLRGHNIPKTINDYEIVQNNNSIQYYKNIDMSLYFYEEDVIDKWKLIDETRTIETFICKKAELHYKGRDWIAWYCPEIPLPYGPYKFSGLPGLIVQMSDKTGEYGFRLMAAKSSEISNDLISLRSAKYTKAKKSTQHEFEDAIDNFNENLENNSIGTNTTIDVDPNFFRDRREKYRQYKEDFNPLEIPEKE